MHRIGSRKADVVRFVTVYCSARVTDNPEVIPVQVKKKTRCGEIPGRKVGRRWKYRLSELDAWARSTVISRQPQSRRVI
jgi:hypothetical protein